MLVEAIVVCVVIAICCFGPGLMCIGCIIAGELGRNLEMVPTSIRADATTFICMDETTKARKDLWFLQTIDGKNPFAAWTAWKEESTLMKKMLTVNIQPSECVKDELEQMRFEVVSKKIEGNTYKGIYMKNISFKDFIKIHIGDSEDERIDDDQQCSLEKNGIFVCKQLKYTIGFTDKQKAKMGKTAVAKAEAFLKKNMEGTMDLTILPPTKQASSLKRRAL